MVEVFDGGTRAERLKIGMGNDSRGQEKDESRRRGEEEKRKRNKNKKKKRFLTLNRRESGALKIGGGRIAAVKRAVGIIIFIVPHL